METKTSLYWKICCAAAFSLVIITFTPIITPAGVHKPELLGIPFTLWAGILIAVGLVLLTFIGTRIHPSRKEGSEK
jgi:hypothetical protein